MSTVSKRLVVALGGNAISTPNKQGTVDEQFAQTRQSARLLCDAIVEGHQLVITHGNGPQVGNVLRRVELARTELYPIPLEICVADTQAGMGYMIAQCVMNELAERGQPQIVSTLVSTVLVDRNDPAFVSPTKPIGPRLDRAIAEAHQLEDGWEIQQVDDKIFRRIVPSPRPLEILEIETIRRIVEANELVVCCGGGGIPVCRDAQGQTSGAAAVIDKDLTTVLLAQELGIDTVVILTSVEHVCLNFGKPNQRELKQITLFEAKRHLETGQFPEGSMRPKIEAAIEFLERSPSAQPLIIIASLEKFPEALAGNSGTRVVRE